MVSFMTIAGRILSVKKKIIEIKSIISEQPFTIQKISDDIYTSLANYWDETLGSPTESQLSRAFLTGEIFNISDLPTNAESIVQEKSDNTPYKEKDINLLGRWDYSCPGDQEILNEQFKCLEKLYDFNSTRPSEMEKRQALLKEMFAEIGEDCYIEPPLRANWGGKHIHFGNSVYANFNLTCVDDTHIYVGDCTMFAPNVILATAGHPILPELREKAYQFNMPILSYHFSAGFARAKGEKMLTIADEYCFF